MNKPNDFENTQAAGDFTPVELGAHYAIIKNVSEKETQNGDPMIVVSIDFDKKDAQSDYFTEAFKKDVRPDKKYPNQATSYIMSEYDGKCTRNFKTFIKAFADSNGLKETDIKWGTDFVKQFKNKKVGVVFGEVEELYNGEQKMKRKIRWFCDYAKVPDQKTPQPVFLKEENTPAAAPKTDDGFMSLPEGEEEIPFD